MDFARKAHSKRLGRCVLRKRSASMRASGVPSACSPDQAGDQREDDARSLVFETMPLGAPIEILGAASVTLDITSDEPIANLAVRLCDVRPSGESLRVSYGVLNLTHRDGHETPAPLVAGTALPSAHSAQRRRRGISGRPQGAARTVHDVLADDLARLRRRRH